MIPRAAALLALAAFAVHEARYHLFPDAHADAGHGYLAAAPAVLGILLALACGHTLAALGRRSARPRGRLSWTVATAALLAAHGGQELVERAVIGGDLFGEGLLAVLPLCAVAGLAVVAALRRAERLLDETPPPARVRWPSVVVPPAGAASPTQRRARWAGMARHLAGRAPPLRG